MSDSTNKKIRQCPHCKGKRGFIVRIILGGSQDNTYNFNGKCVDSDRSGADTVDKQVECVDCHKFFSIELVEHNET